MIPNMLVGRSMSGSGFRYWSGFWSRSESKSGKNNT